MTFINVWSRDYTVTYCAAMTLEDRYYAKKLGLYHIKKEFLLKHNGVSTMYMDEKEITDSTKMFLKKYAARYSDLMLLEKKFKSFASKVMKFTQKIEEKKLKRTDLKQLNTILEDYYPFWLDFSAYLRMTFHLSEGYAQLAAQKLSGKVSKDVLDYMMTPSKKASIMLLDEEIASFGKKKININLLYKKYQWIPFGDFNVRPWTAEKFKEYVREHKHSEQKKVDLHKLPAKYREMIRINKELAYIRDYRDEVRRRTNFKIYLVMKEIANRRKEPYENLTLYTMPEIFSGVYLKAEELEARKGNILYLVKGDKVLIYTGDAIKEELKKLNFNLDETLSADSIKGTPASKGIIQGRAKIIRLISELDKIEKGDIMIAITTHPDFVPKMKLCMAIVTDQGGLTCHAAIVARELGIPCIVGTKHSTKIFKDGDYIEVNANHGTVQRVKK